MCFAQPAIFAQISPVCLFTVVIAIYQIYLFAFSSLCWWIFLPTSVTVTSIPLFLWYRVLCNDRLPFYLVDYNNFIICLIYIKLYYFVDAGSWRQIAVTPFNWFVSSYSLNWIANISFVWTTDEWFHQTTTYFFVSFMKTVLQTGKTVLQTVANWKNIFILL